MAAENPRSTPHVNEGLAKAIGAEKVVPFALASKDAVTPAETRTPDKENDSRPYFDHASQATKAPEVVARGTGGREVVPFAVSLRTLIDNTGTAGSNPVDDSTVASVNAKDTTIARDGDGSPFAPTGISLDGSVRATDAPTGISLDGSVAARRPLVSSKAR